MKTTLQNLARLLFVPTLVLVALLAMYTRTSQVLVAVEDGTFSKLLSPAVAVAEEAKPEEKKPEEAPKVEEKKTEEKPAPSSPAAAAANAAPKDDAGPRSDIGTETVLTDEDIVILQQLAQRRKDLDKRAAELEQREALLQASEAKLNAKAEELKTIQQNMQGLIETANKYQEDRKAQQTAQLKSLIKIYETMKPAQAAKIFEQMDMPRLLLVVRGMKEAKSSAVLAAMDPVKAKAVTTEIMRGKDMPDLNAMSLDTLPNQSAGGTTPTNP